MRDSDETWTFFAIFKRRKSFREIRYPVVTKKHISIQIIFIFDDVVMLMLMILP